jgi:hypothetical protein
MCIYFDSGVGWGFFDTETESQVIDKRGVVNGVIKSDDWALVSFIFEDKGLYIAASKPDDLRPSRTILLIRSNAAKSRFLKP